MYGIPDSVKPLSAAEEQVMLAVWACRAPATRRDIDAKLRAKGWAPATVLNFLYRLAGTLPQPCGRWSARAAAARASWNRP